MAKIILVTLALRSILRCNISWFFSSASNVIRLVSKKTMARSKATSYRCAQVLVGFCFFCQLRANCKSGGRHKLVLPIWYMAAASETRVYIRADSNSSSTQVASRVQIRIKLSCEISTNVSGVRGTLMPGIKNERPVWRNFSTT